MLYARHGLTTWDVFSIFIMTIPGGLGPVLYNKAYKGLGEKLTAFLGAYKKTYTGYPFVGADYDEEAIFSTVKRRVMLIGFMGILMSLLMMPANYLYVADVVTVGEAATYGIMCGLCLYNMFAPPVAIGTVHA